MWEQSFKIFIPDLSMQVITIKVMTLSRGQPEVVGENRIIASELCDEILTVKK
jgi:hypothetical protein